MRGIHSFANITSRSSSDLYTGNSKRTKKYFAYVSKSHVLFLTVHLTYYYTWRTSIYSCTAPCWTWQLFQFVYLITVGRTPWTGDQHKHRINARRHPCLVGFEPRIPVFEREKTVHALDCADTVIGDGVCKKSK
jgi:hypothetical protein